MEIEKIQMPKERAKEEWKLYTDLIKKKHSDYMEDMKKCMYELKQGRELIDIYKEMEKAGLNKHNQPKLAIARADWKVCHFHKKDSGRGFFSGSSATYHNKADGHIDLKDETFSQWERGTQDINLEKGGTGKLIRNEEWMIAKSQIKTKVPIIPIQLMPDGTLDKYYILWEVFQWEDLPKTDDPLLLKRITENLFVILSAWDVTPLEQSIISGR